MSATCRSCGAPIVWALTPKGKRMPLDALPVVGGSWLIVDGAIEPAVAGVGHRSHFETCPDAAQHRKPR